MATAKSKRTWIGHRSLQIGTTKKISIRVKIAQPERVAPGEWRCPYEIRGAGMSGIQYVRGVDALQALDLAFQVIRIRLDGLKGKVTWEGNPVQLAFPKRIPYIGTLKFTKKIEQQVESELMRHLAELKRKAERKRKAK
jgi:hypothetical protein